MEYQINHRTLPQVAVGTWAWGTGVNGSKMIFGTRNDEQVLKQCFEKAYEDGFILWDTAAVYGMGEAERILNDCIQEKSIILSDKYTPGKKFKEAKMLQMLEDSGKRLSGRIPDIYWLHTPKNIEKNIEVMYELLQQKKIASIGISNANMDQILEADSILQRHGLHLSGVQNHYSLLYRNSENSGILNWCKEHKVPFFAYMVLEQGALTGRFNGNHGFPRLSRRGMAFSKSRLRKIEGLLQELKVVGEKHDLSVAETAIAWSIAKGTIPIVGVTKVYQAEGLKKMKDIKLSDEEITKLEVAAQSSGVHVKASWE